MPYTIEEQGGGSRAAKTIILYSLIILLFGAILGGFYFWISNSQKANEPVLQEEVLTEEQVLNQLNEDLTNRNEDMQFATDEELQAYIETNMPDPYPGTEQAEGEGSTTVEEGGQN